MAVDAHGDLFIADDGVILEVTPGPDGLPSDGTSSLSRSGTMGPGGAAVDANGDVFINTLGNTVHEARPGPDGLLSDGSVITVAGAGSPGYTADGGPAVRRR